MNPTANNALEHFLLAHELHQDYLSYAQNWFARLADGLSKPAGRPLVLGINGCQGSGKSTLADWLVAYLAQSRGTRAVALSLDDFYLTLAERQALADRVHPLLLTRGVPGSHDVSLAIETIVNLRCGNAPAVVPRFNKAVDDRLPPDQWDTIAAGVELIILEGWCLGITPQEEGALEQPINTLEREQDPGGRWRHFVNGALAGDYQALFSLVDEWVMLRAPSFDCVFRWRLEQEQKLARRNGAAAGVMDEQGVADFIRYYQRLTEHALETLPARVEHLYQLDEQRQVASYRGPGDR